ncbi:MAG: amidohydrolase family protein [Rhodospirillales bacterium]
MDTAAVEPFAIDADGHVIEPNEAWETYLPAIYRDRAPRYRANDEGKFRFYVDDVGHPPFPAMVSIRKPMEASNRIRVLDNESIQSAIIFPSAGLLVPYMQDAGVAVACMRAYNDWLADWCGAFPERLLPVGLLTLHDIAAAAAEARRAATEKGVVALAIRPNPIQGRNLDDPAYDPLYATVQDLGLPLIIHESTGCPQTLGADRYGIDNPAAYTFNHVVSHSMEQMFAALSVICGGVLERFPRLKVGFFEAGCSWAPYWLGRLDSHFEHRSMRKQMPLLTMKPSEYFARQCAVTCDPDDDTIPLAIQGIGADHILFASDYPHFDSGAGPVREFLEKGGISPTDQRKILRDNAVAFFKLDVPAPVDARR